MSQNRTTTAARPYRRQESSACRRAELIMKVRAGTLTATQAAADLAVSRKTYYEWENRALAALLEALTERATGRPANTPDPEKEELRRRIAELEKEKLLLNRKLALRERLDELFKSAADRSPVTPEDSKKNGARLRP